ncbi:MAG: FAD-dependent oxidoreductase [Candidatus Bathyarchaeota archaeon]|nr:FAD-dependent oxidoreductase [Candidatus Bathyarchaeota archaeon]
MSRRDFLKTAAAGAAAAGLAGVTSRSFLRDLFPPVKAQERIPINSAIVVGSGLAGLTAAMLLTDMGKEVTVLEQCHKPGGRVQDLRYPDGSHACVSWEEWFNRQIDPDVWWLLSKLGFAGDDYTRWEYDTFYYWRNKYCFDTWNRMINECLPWDDPGGAEDYWEFDDEVWFTGSMETPWETGKYPDYDYTDFKDWILWNPQGKPHHRTDVNEFIALNMRAEFGTPTSDGSAALGLDSWYYWEYSDCWSLNDGNYQVIERLCSRIPPGSLHLNETVNSVENTATGVEVTSKKGRYTADVAIVAVPHNVVASMVPELPSERVAALNTLGTPRNIKAIQQYTEPFWDTLYSMYGWGGYIDTHKECVCVESSLQNIPKGILGQYINEPEVGEFWGNAKGIHLKGGSARNVTNAMLDDLDQFWPASQYFIDGSDRVYQWEPYVPLFPPRYVLDGTYVLNRQPINGIFFAGDYVYGAGASPAIASARDAVANFT